MSAADWDTLTAKQITLWIGDPEMGLWCPRCNLPSGYRAPVRRDPAEPATTWMHGCAEDDTHRSAVANFAQPPVDCDGCICGCPSCGHVCGIEDEDDE